MVIDISNGEYAIYLRKSRADFEAEARGEGETLARHEKILIDLAIRMKIGIGKIYREIVSGENILDRPEMQNLISDVRNGRWKGVLVVEVERLARGNTKDQGIVAESFSISSTKIITPIKTYDPDNEYDQEYFEFGLFMSRREYKVINRRLQQGRVASVNEGKYVGSIAPFGWNRIKIKNDKGYTLEPNFESKIVQTMFETFAYTDISLKELGRKLDEMGMKPRYTEKWTSTTIKDILRNPVYIGKIKWNSRKTVKEFKNGKIVKTRPRNPDIILKDGLHSAIIKQETWNIVQQKLSQNKPPVRNCSIIQNPLVRINPLCKMWSIDAKTSIFKIWIRAYPIMSK